LAVTRSALKISRRDSSGADGVPDGGDRKEEGEEASLVDEGEFSPFTVGLTSGRSSASTLSRRTAFVTSKYYTSDQLCYGTPCAQEAQQMVEKGLLRPVGRGRSLRYAWLSCRHPSLPGKRGESGTLGVSTTLWSGRCRGCVSFMSGLCRDYVWITEKPSGDERHSCSVFRLLSSFVTSRTRKGCSQVRQAVAHGASEAKGAELVEHL